MLTIFDAADGHHRVRSVEPHAADDGQFGIGPVQTFVEVVHGQTCGEGGHQDIGWCEGEESVPASFQNACKESSQGV